MNKDDIYMSRKKLRIFTINYYGSDITVKEIEIILSCNIVNDDYVSIQINTL